MNAASTEDVLTHAEGEKNGAEVQVVDNKRIH